MKPTIRPSYRVELRTPNSIKCMASDLLCDGHLRSLDPFVSKLALERASGTLILVESTTGLVVAKRKLADPFETRGVVKWSARTVELDQRLERIRSILLAEVS